MASDDLVGFFTILIVAQMFFSIGITAYGAVAPGEAKVYLNNLFGIDLDISEIANEMETGLSNQADAPLLDLGALAFYSGNVILSLLLNFVFAVPSMVTIIFSALTLVVTFDSAIMNYLQLFIFLTFTIIYIFSLLRLLSGIRTGRIV